jgi:RNA polymerase sigma factor (TIGR02999 family)
VDGQITHLLGRIADGDEQAQHQLLASIYPDLKRRARALAGRERDALTLGVTGLLHESYLRLMGSGQARFQNRRHFYAAAGEAMRRILIERARSLARIKRGCSAERVALLDEHVADSAAPDEVLLLDQLLGQLEACDELMANVVKLRYFGGMSVEETAEALETSPRSVNRAWTGARAWLRLRLEEIDQSAASQRPAAAEP